MPVSSPQPTTTVREVGQRLSPSSPNKDDDAGVFFVWPVGSQGEPVPSYRRCFSFFVTGVEHQNGHYVAIMPRTMQGRFQSGNDD